MACAEAKQQDLQQEPGVGRPRVANGLGTQRLSKVPRPTARQDAAKARKTPQLQLLCRTRARERSLPEKVSSSQRSERRSFLALELQIGGTTERSLASMGAPAFGERAGRFQMGAGMLKKPERPPQNEQELQARCRQAFAC